VDEDKNNKEETQDFLHWIVDCSKCSSST